MITPRLEAIINMIPPCHTLVDVGTDHGYVPIRAVSKNIAKVAVATDVVLGPVEAARKSVKQYGLQDKIAVEMGNGLKNIEFANVIVVAGMGGKLIWDIINGNLSVAKSADCLILQPMTAQTELRKLLNINGFSIVDEGLAIEGNQKSQGENSKIYNIFKVQYLPENCCMRSEFEYYIGWKLLENRPQLLGQYLNVKYAVVDKTLRGLQSSKKMDESPLLQDKLEYFANLHKLIKKEIEVQTW